MENNKSEAFVYKTTNITNGKFYVGVRTRRNDSTDIKYLGSGIAINTAIRKYGVDNFIREIVFEGSQDDCYELENFIVDSDFIKRHDTYNQRIGGKSHENQTGVHNTSFKGYWVTPFGVFVSSTSAAKFIGVSKYTIQRRCKDTVNKYWYFIGSNETELHFDDNLLFSNPLLTSDYEIINPMTFSKTYNPMNNLECRKKSQDAQKKRSVSVSGVNYISVNEAARQLGFSKQRLKHRLKSGNYQDHYYTDVDNPSGVACKR